MNNKLYRVYNGFTGNGAVHVLVVAGSETKARLIAADEFKREGGKQYGKSYYNLYKLKVEEVFGDLTQEHVSEVDSG